MAPLSLFPHFHQLSSVWAKCWYKEGKFDIVLTDLGMPGMSGWEARRMIKEISPHTPVGMITGWGDERNRNKMEEHGLDFLISKPFDFAQILNTVAETMESRKE
jgi:CheY-like chemotaxis protein